MQAPLQPTPLEQKIAQYPFWYHKIELTDGITTPGWAPLVPHAYNIPDDLTGKRVLDIGAWDGYWTFEALKRGADQAIAIDDFSDYLGHLDTRDRHAWETFDLCREALGYDHERCQRHEMSIYHLTPDVFGTFDYVFFFGVLYHLRYPLLSLDLVSSVCTDSVFIETAICDDFSPYQGGIGHGYPGRQAVVEFYPGDEYGGNHTNWWAPNLASLGCMVQAAGFQDVTVWKLKENPESLPECRGFAIGKKSP